MSSLSESESESSSTPPAPGVPIPKSKKSKAALKNAGDNGKNEGTNPHWKYTPPPGAVPFSAEIDDSDFDWDAVNDNDDLELWLIRVPDGVKSKYLEGLELDAPSSSRTAQIGSLVRKHATFDIWSVGEDADAVGGEEVKGLSCLLPRKREKGKLVKAPKPIARHLILAAQPIQPAADPTVDPKLSPAQLYKSPAREAYPSERLKHCFVPYGALRPQAQEIAAAAPADADVKMGPIPDEESPSKEVKKSKVKKRKVDDLATPKKARKSKAAS